MKGGASAATTASSTMMANANASASSTTTFSASSLFTTMSFDGTEFFRILSAPEFPSADAKRWTDGRWPLVLQVCTLYVIAIFSIQRVMRNRPAFGLFVPLNAWNAFLAAFSIMGTIKLTPEFFRVLFGEGFQPSYCQTLDYTEGTNGYWVWLFIVSKMFELVDTIFLVLRKRPLLFLHWYHHILTMIYAFYSYPITPGFNRWGIYLNFMVHAFMYSYYFLRSMKVRVPGPVAKFITTIQIWQFVISVAILVHLGRIVYTQNVRCDLEDRVFTLASFMDITYLVLFINFFVQSYVIGGGKAKYRGGAKKEKADGSAISNGTVAGATIIDAASSYGAGDVRRRPAAQG